MGRGWQMPDGGVGGGDRTWNLISCETRNGETEQASREKYKVSG